MNQLKRRLSVVLLALVLIALPAAAQGETAVDAAPAAEHPARWSTFVFDFLSGFFDGLWSVEAASETGSTKSLDPDDAEPGFAPTMDPNGGLDALRSPGGFAPTMDPNG